MEWEIMIVSFGRVRIMLIERHWNRWRELIILNIIIVVIFRPIIIVSVKMYDLYIE